MKMIIALAALVGVAVAAPLGNDHSNVILVKNLPSDNTGIGDYQFGYGLSNGVTRDEAAKYIDGSPVVVGSFSWIDPASDQPIVTRYVADQFGYRAEGSHIPT